MAETMKHLTAALAGMIGASLVIVTQACWEGYLQFDASAAEVWKIKHMVSWDKSGVISKRFMSLTEDSHLSKADVREIERLKEVMARPHLTPTPSLESLRKSAEQNGLAE